VWPIKVSDLITPCATSFKLTKVFEGLIVYCELGFLLSVVNDWKLTTAS
jgi:hypothetical protein